MWIALPNIYGIAGGCVVGIWKLMEARGDLDYVGSQGVER